MLTAEQGLNVTCATTVCQARGFTPAGMTADDREIYWRMIQGPAVRKYMAERGLTLTHATIGEGGAFEIYYLRAQSEPRREGAAGRLMMSACDKFSVVG